MGRAPLEPAKPLGGRYQISQLLGLGGFGQTFLAQDLHLPGHPRCVVKQLKPQVHNSQELQVARRLFDTEAQVLYRLGSHPQIPSLLAHFEENQEFYLAQELIVGHSLEQELTHQPAWEEQDAVAFLHDLLSTLAFVHDHQVIHRDIKPSNLIRRHSDHRIVLIDFGAVKQVSTQLTTASSSLNRTISIGTEGYMPSEQLAGRPQFSSDVYAAGVIAIQGLTGCPPHTIPAHGHSGELNWHSLAPHCHPALVALLDYMVQYDFRSRYGTAAAALAALQDTFPQTPGGGPSAYRTAADHATSGMASAPSPSRAVQTVAVGRRPQASTIATAPQTGSERSRPQSRRPGNPLLPLGLGLLGLLGVGILIWRTFLSSPMVEPVSQETEPAAEVTPESSPTPEPVPEGEALEAPAEPEPDVPVLDQPETGTSSSGESVAAAAAPPGGSPPSDMAESDPTDTPEPTATLTPDIAQATVASLYRAVSNQSWDTARGLFGEALGAQFDPGFFEQFERVTIDNLRVGNQTGDMVELMGRNTYYYPDGTQQQEERTFRVQMVEGQPRIVGSDFVQVLRPRL